MLHAAAIVTLANLALAAAGNRPHIVTIIADDFGWANVGYHRSSDFKETVTPNIDALVKDGIELDRHYAYHICSPSRSSFQSGRLPVHVNTVNVEPIVHNPNDPIGGYQGIPVNMTGIAQKMKEGGYKTHMTGKWDAGMATERHIPTGRGYDTFFGYFHHANNYWTQKLSLTATGEHDICGNKYIDLWDTNKPAYNKSGTAYEEELFETATIDVIKAHDVSQPLFLVHAFHIVHTPLQVPREYERKFSFIKEPGRKTYAAMVNYMDEVIGRLVDALKAKQMWSNTLLVFFSDNGGPLYILGNANNYPLRGGKFSDWEGGHRVNAFVSGGLVPSTMIGTKFEGLVSIVDWYTTFAALAGVNPHDDEAERVGLPGIDGLNVWPALAGQTASSPRDEIHLSTQALIQGKYKLIVGEEAMNLWPGEYYPTFLDTLRRPSVPGHGKQRLFDCKLGCLFNIYDDPSERTDLADKLPDVLTKMQLRLQELNKSFYNPDRGTESKEACEVAEKNGGYYAPFLQQRVGSAEKNAPLAINV